MPEELWTVKQVARRLQVHESTVRRWIENGELKAVRVGGFLLRVQESDVQAFLRSVKDT